MLETGFKNKTYKERKAGKAYNPADRQDDAYDEHTRCGKTGGSIPLNRIQGNERNGQVDDEKRQKVERAISETGFKPNEVARSLYKRSSKIIGHTGAKHHQSVF